MFRFLPVLFLLLATPASAGCTYDSALGWQGTNFGDCDLGSPYAPSPAESYNAPIEDWRARRDARDAEQRFLRERWQRGYSVNRPGYPLLAPTFTSPGIEPGPGDSLLADPSKRWRPSTGKSLLRD